MRGSFLKQMSLESRREGLAEQMGDENLAGTQQQGESGVIIHDPQ